MRRERFLAEVGPFLRRFEHWPFRPAPILDAIMPSPLTALFAAVTLPLIPLAAQELLAVNYNGQVLKIATATGATSVLNPNGVPFANAMALDGSTYWATGRQAGVSRLFKIDPVTGHTTPSISLGQNDVRGLADGNNTDELFGVVNGTNDVDRLVRIRPSLGLVLPIGGTSGQTGIQALVRDGAQLIAWDVQVGLCRFDTTTGAAIDLFPATGTGGAQIQFLTVDEQGRLLGGHDQLYEIERTTGIATVVPGSNCLNARGAEPRRGTIGTFGVACGDDAVLTATGQALVGTTMTFTSSGHQPGAFVTLYFAFEKQTTAIPGSTCKLGVASDNPFYAATVGASGIFTVNEPLVSLLGFEMFVQALGAQPGTGTPYVTNGIDIRIAH